MFFNPLFLQVINNPESINSAKSQKLNGASYLFSDIIKVAFEKSETESLNGAGVNETALGGFGSPGGFEASAFLNEITAGTNQTESALYQLLGEVVPGNFKLGDLSGNNGIVGLPLVNNNDSKSIILSETEAASMIAKFLDGNFQGKVNVLSGKDDQKKINVKSFDVEGNNALSSGDLFELLKEGNAVSLESSDARNTKGLLITLFKISSDEAAGLTGLLTENNADSETAETGEETGTESTDPLSEPNSAASDKLYRVEINLFDKTGYQELSSLAFSKSAVSAANEIMQSAKDQKTSENTDLAFQSSKIFRTENGLNGPADMSAFTGINEETAEDFSAVNQAKINPESSKASDPGMTAADAKQNNIPAAKNGTAAAVSNSESANTALYGSNAEGTNIQGQKSENAVKTGENILNGASASGSIRIAAAVNAPSAENHPGTAGSQPVNKKHAIAKEEDYAAATTKNSRQAESLTAAQDVSAAASRLNKSGVLKNVNLTMKSSRAVKEINPQADTPDGNTLQFRQSDKNLNNVSGPDQAANTEIPANDLKELNKNISDRIFAKQMHDAGSSVKENEAKPVNAQAEKADGQSAQTQETASAQYTSDGTENEMAAGTNEQHTWHQKSEHQTGNNDIQFTSEINKAAENTVREKPAAEGGQSNLPHKLVKAADVIKEISSFIERNESHSLTIKIDPESLGTVKIALDMVDKLVHANIEVENEAAKKMMENNLNQLQHSLAQNGIQLNSLNISLANQDNKQNKNTAGKKRTSNNEVESEFNQEGVKESRQMGYNTYEYTI